MDTSDTSDAEPGEGIAMAAPVTALRDNPRAAEEMDRRARVTQALADGSQVASADMRDGEYFSMLHRGMCAILASARHLTPNEHAFLWAYLAHSHSRCAYAVADVNGSTPPKLTDWGRWLGGVSKQQVYAIRESLHQKGILAYVEDDPSRVALNLTWERWDANVFQPNTSRASAGRKGGTSPKSKAYALPGEEVNQGLYPESSTGFTTGKPYALPESSTGFTTDPDEAALVQAPEDALRKKTIKTLRIPANAGGAADAASPTSAESGDEQDEQVVETTSDESRSRSRPPVGWLERAPGENDERYYTRIVPQCRNVPAAVAYVAYETLAIDPGKSTIQRLSGMVGTLRRTYGDEIGRWGLIVKALVKASGAEYDSDPLDYVQGIARDLAAAEMGKRNSHPNHTGNPTRSTPGRWRAGSANPTTTATTGAADARMARINAQQAAVPDVIGHLARGGR